MKPQIHLKVRSRLFGTFAFAASLFLSGCLKEAASVLFDQQQLPTGVVTVANSKYTNTPAVTINITSSNATEMAIFIDRQCDYYNAPVWEPLAASKALTLPQQEGAHQVSVLFRNEGRYQSECQTLEYVYDISPPTSPTAFAVRSRTTTLSASALFGFSASTDVCSPISKYQVRAITTGGTSLSSWSDITDISSTSAQTHYVSGLSLADGTSYALELRAVDAAGNMSAVNRSTNFEAGPVLTMANKYLYIPSGTFAVGITLSRALAVPLTLHVQTEAIDAIPGIDFLSADYALTVNSGTTSTNATLMPLDAIIPGAQRQYKLKVAESPSPAHFVSNTFQTAGVSINSLVTDSTGATLVAVGARSSCFVKSGNEIRCLGPQTNNGSSFWIYGVPASTGVLITDPTGGLIRKLVSGGQTCALDEFQQLLCWGYNGGYAVGNGTTGTTPYLPFMPFNDVIDVSSSSNGTCVIHDGGAVTCWGANTSGRFGTGNTTTSSANVSPIGHGASDTPPALPVHVALGAAHMCLLLDDGTVKCVGSNAQGALGNGDASVTQSLTFLNVNLPGFADDLVAGENAVCAHLDDGRYACWGSALSVATGFTNVVADRATPKPVPLFANAKKVAMSDKHGCVVSQSDDLYCWGYNQVGQLANPLIKTSVNFSRSTNFTEKVKDVAVADLMTCATSLAGGAYCWGASDYANGDYQRGTPDFYQTAGAHLSLTSDVVSLRMGFGLGCVIKTDKTAWCWGSNAIATTDTTTDNFYSLQAKQVFAGSVLDVSSGTNHLCVIAEVDKAVYCRGKNTYGQLGDGTTTDSDLIYKRVLNVSDVKQISSGPEYSCAVTNPGLIYCWGRSANGQVGSNVAGNFTSTPVQVPTLPAMSMVRVGRLHACGIASGTGTVYCWGDNSFGQIGSGSTGGTTAPTLVPSLTNVTKLAVGAGYTMINTATGSARCWGTNSYGQFGVGTKSAAVPTPGSCGLTGSAVAIAASEYVSCIINSGFVQCSGSNIGGAAGVGGASEYLSPTYAPNTELSGVEIGLSSVYDISLTTLVSGCVLTKYPGATSGRVNCWGGAGYAIGARTKGRDIPQRIKFD